jgi:hypothetical protein
LPRKPRASKGSAGTATDAGERRWGNAPGPPRRGLRDHWLQPLHFRIHQIARIAIRVTPIDRTLLFRHDKSADKNRNRHRALLRKAQGLPPHRHAL